MKKVEFNLDYYMKHHPMLVTRIGQKARMLDANMLGFEVTICAAILFDGRYECPMTYYKDGRYLKGRKTEYDLFMLIH